MNAPMIHKNIGLLSRQHTHNYHFLDSRLTIVDCNSRGDRVEGSAVMNGYQSYLSFWYILG